MKKIIFLSLILFIASGALYSMGAVMTTGLICAALEDANTHVIIECPTDEFNEIIKNKCYFFATYNAKKSGADIYQKFDIILDTTNTWYFLMDNHMMLYKIEFLDSILAEYDYCNIGWNYFYLENEENNVFLNRLYEISELKIRITDSSGNIYGIKLSEDNLIELRTKAQEFKNLFE